MLDEILGERSARDCVKIVFLHHHPFYHSSLFRLLDGKALMRLVFGRAEVIAFGHKHVAGLWRCGGGTQWIVAAENSPGRATVREIAVEGGRVEVRDVAARFSS